ncbi:LOW QUALITY PROTEIN: hypothetical protein ElyMa_006115000 [Elysia marginata]|uniref:Secreted protein n=1 Tax=Elysia marginata TaxID=1093978 RepID=A0AAV4GXG1_9GAST|nr:LOW QUALITY PROTEIN: hypothetical protein ElyMa_006115000 [Elysia marginata]
MLAAAAAVVVFASGLTPGEVPVNPLRSSSSSSSLPVVQHQVKYLSTPSAAAVGAVVVVVFASGPTPGEVPVNPVCFLHHYGPGPACTCC